MKAENINLGLTSTTPESRGISSGAVEEFLNDLEKKQLNMHGFILIRNGSTVAEGYWPPFNESSIHRIYSISKSVTAVAIGRMIGEGKISLSSKVADFFPEHIPDNPHPYVMQATVRDLLMMSTFNKENSYNNETPDFTESFFKDNGPKHKAGTIFCYDTAATTVLCAIVEKLSGQTLLSYMDPVLKEIGFTRETFCIEAPEGRSWTGSGVLWTARELALFAQLCMNLGEWNGKQLINREYMQEATSKQIDTTINGGCADMRRGYGYQIWCLKDGGFGMYGMGSQYALCMPKYDTILITIADTQGEDDSIGIIHDAFYKLLDTFSCDALPENTDAGKKLEKRIAELKMPMPTGSKTTKFIDDFTSKKFMLEENEQGIKWLRLKADNDLYRLEYENASGEHELIFGACRYEPFLFPEKYYGTRIGTRDRHYRCIGAAAWVDDNTMLGTIYSIDDYLGSIHLQLTFSDCEVSGIMVKNAEWFFEEYQGFFNSIPIH